FGGLDRHRLFHQHIQARPCGGEHHLVVQGVRGGDDDGVGSPLCDEVPVVGETACATGRSQGACHLLVQVADGADLHVRQRGGRIGVRAGHGPCPNKSNFHRCFLSVPPQEDRTTIRGRRLIWWIGVGWLARSRRIRISASRRPSSYFGGETAVSGISATSALSSS